MILRTADAIGLFYVRPPTVDTAHAAHGTQHSDTGPARNGQFLYVLRRFDFLSCIGQRAECKRLIDCLQREGLLDPAESIISLQHHLPGLHMNTAILRHKRRFYMGDFLPAAKRTALAAVRICLTGKTDPLSSAHRSRRLEFDAEAG